ncbi:MAG: NUDIX domain-containing protein [Myxococcales bacterium]|nr:NUDIX domain-containing protein [Myxococcales bacterium]
MGTRSRRSTASPPSTTARAVDIRNLGAELIAPRLAVSAFVFDAEQRLLVVRRGRPPGEGLWSVPGGKVMPGETLAAAVAREVREETACEVRCGAVLEVVERCGEAATGPYHYVIIAHAATLQRQRIPQAGSDAAAAAFVALADLSHRPCTEGLRELAARALSRPNLG